MSGTIELTIEDKDDGGGAWVSLEGVVTNVDGHAAFSVDRGALDLLEAILKARRPGTYEFSAEV